MDSQGTTKLSASQEQQQPSGHPSMNARYASTGVSNGTAIQSQRAKFALQPSFAHSISQDDSNVSVYSKWMQAFGNCCGAIGQIPICVCFPNPWKQVPEGYIGIVLRFGKYSRSVDPGLTKVNPFAERLATVDIKEQIVEVPQQTAMTKDNVSVQISSVIYYHVTSPYRAVFGVSNVRQALIERTQTTLRHVLGARVLQDAIERREEVAQSIREIIAEVSEGWGVSVEGILIKDILFSRELQDSLSMAAQSKRIGESKIIAARAEVESAKLMRQAADILASKAAMQIRWLEAMQTISKSPNAKVIFMPTPPSQMKDDDLNITAKDTLGNTTTFLSDGGIAGPSSKPYEGFTADPAFNQLVQAQVIDNI